MSDFDLDLDLLGLEVEGDPFSDERILEATGASSMEDIVVLRLKVDTTDASLGDLGVRLPNVTELKLNNSNIFSTRDLGTGFHKVEVLWIARSGVVELEGIGSFSSLTELYAAFNDISDLSPFSTAETIEVIDLEGNVIDDFDQLDYLATLDTLHTITLEGNPIQDKQHYRLRVIRHVPQLEMLDDEPVTDEEKREAAELPSDSELARIDEEEEEEREKEEEGEEEKEGGRDSSSSQPRSGRRWSEQQMVNQGIKYARVEDDALMGSRPGTARTGDVRSSLSAPGRPGSAMLGARPMSAVGSRPGSARVGTGIGTAARVFVRPGSAVGGRPSTARPSTATLFRRGVSTDEEEEGRDASSDLTFGTSEVFCGNPVVALRNRKADAVVDDLPKRPQTAGSIFTSFSGNIDPADILEQLRMLKIQRGGSDMLDEADQLREGDFIGGEGDADRLVLESDSDSDGGRGRGRSESGGSSRRESGAHDHTNRSSDGSTKESKKRPPRRPLRRTLSSGVTKHSKQEREAFVEEKKEGGHESRRDESGGGGERRRPLRPSRSFGGERAPPPSHIDVHTGMGGGTMHADMSPISPGQSSTSLFAGMHHSSSTGLRGSSGLPPRAKPTTESGVTVPHVPTRPRPRSKGSPKKTLVAATVEGGGGGSGARWEEANRGLEGGSESREREKSRREEERRARKEKREKRERAKQEKEGGRHGHSHKHPHVGSVHDHSEDVSGGDGGLDAFLKEQMAQQRRINAEGLHDENFSASFSALKAAHRDLAAAESDGEDEESSAIGGSRRHSSEVNPFGEEGGLSPVGGSSGGAVTGALSSSEFSPWGNEEEAGYEDLGKAYAPPLNAIASPRRDMPVGRIRPGMSSKISQASYYSEEE